MCREPNEIYAAHRPRKGDPITYKSERVGVVVKVEGNLCWRTYPDGESMPFIWCFKDGLNKLHDWPTKSAKAEGRPMPEVSKHMPIKNWRWKCPHCGTDGWEVISKQGVIPDHARANGRDCIRHRAAIAKAEGRANG